MRRKPPLAIGLDVGTTTIKLGVFGADLRPVLTLSTPVEIYRQNDRVELDAEQVFTDVRRLLDEAAQLLGPESQNIIGLGLAAQRSTVVFWNDAGTLAPAMTWQDVRTAGGLSELAEHEPAIEAKTGLRLTPHYSAPKIQWALANSGPVQKALATKQLKAGPLSSYLVWKLTEGRTFAVDHSQAQRTLLLNLARRAWDPSLCRWFGVPRRILPELRDVRADYGELSFGGREIPIRASIGDTQAAAFAGSLGRKIDLTIQYGTGAFVARYCGTKPASCPGLLTSLYVSEKKRATYFVEGTVNSAGSLLDWLRGNPEIPGSKPLSADRS